MQHFGGAWLAEHHARARRHQLQALRDRLAFAEEPRNTDSRVYRVEAAGDSAARAHRVFVRRIRACLLLISAHIASGCATDTLLGEPTTEPPQGIEAASPCDTVPEEPLDYALPVWDLRVKLEDWDILHEDVLADVSVPATICIDRESYPIDLELQGSSTRKLAKKSFDLKFKRGKELVSWPYDGPEPSDGLPIAKVFLKAMAKDQTLLRESLSFAVWSSLGYETPRHGFANLRVNGAYWGLYAVVEPVNDRYLEQHGYAAPGSLYKAVRKHGSFADFAPGRNLMRAFEAERREDYEALEELVERLQSTPLTAEAFAARIDPIFPLDNYIDRLLWVAFTQNGDAVAQNFYLYHTHDAGRERWYQLPWDSDIALGADWRDPNAELGADDALLLDGGNYFSQRLLEIPALRARYVARFQQVLATAQLTATGLERLAFQGKRIAQDLSLDQARWERMLAPDEAFRRVERFLAVRSEAVRNALATF